MIKHLADHDLLGFPLEMRYIRRMNFYMLL